MKAMVLIVVLAIVCVVLPIVNSMPSSHGQLQESTNPVLADAAPEHYGDEFGESEDYYNYENDDYDEYENDGYDEYENDESDDDKNDDQDGYENDGYDHENDESDDDKNDEHDGYENYESDDVKNDDHDGYENDGYDHENDESDDDENDESDDDKNDDHDGYDDKNNESYDDENDNHDGYENENYDDYENDDYDGYENDDYDSYENDDYDGYTNGVYNNDGYTNGVYNNDALMNDAYNANTNDGYTNGANKNDANNAYNNDATKNAGYAGVSIHQEFRDTQGNLTTEAFSTFPIQYKLYTRQNIENPEDLNPENSSTRLIHGKAHSGTIFIIHGFKSSGNAKWVKAMKDALLAENNVNVIVVDWKKGATLNWPIYQKAAANTRIVGQKTAELIQAIYYLKEISPTEMHVIGHSLGAHCAGFTGKNVQTLTGQTLGRISGLDPAGPLFAKKSSGKRLHISDANFVDIIHTNAGNLIFKSAYGWKKNSPLGHADFYPNGGSKQPGCTPLISGPACSHLRAPLLFISSIKKCTYPTREGAAKCPEGVTSGVRMGYHSYNKTNPPRGTFCLETAGDFPYCEK